MRRCVPVFVLVASLWACLAFAPQPAIADDGNVGGSSSDDPAYIPMLGDANVHTESASESTGPDSPGETADPTEPSDPSEAGPASGEAPDAQADDSPQDTAGPPSPQDAADDGGCEPSDVAQPDLPAEAQETVTAQPLSPASEDGETQPAAIAQADTAADTGAPSIAYRANVQGIGWQTSVKDGAAAGTTGRSLRLEALKVTLNTGRYKGDLQMQARVREAGWQTVRTSGAKMGTTGKAQGILAIRMALTGSLSKYYDIAYRVHMQNKGWQGWRRNGALAGSVSASLRIEAVEIKLVAKEKPASRNGDGVVGVRYKAHVQKKGWQTSRSCNAAAGTTGRALRVEALRLWLDPGTYKGRIEYRVHVQNKGWMPWKRNGAKAGTTGKSLRVEAVQIRLKGAVAKTYDVVYSAHIQNIGWQSKKFNGATAGTTGRALRVEAVRINLVKKADRTGWYGRGTSWRYYDKGKPVSGQWVVTTESPIADNPGIQRYWIDTSGKLAISRMVNPRKALDAGSWLSYAMDTGYVIRNVMTKLSGTWYYADNDGLLTKVGNIGEKISAYVNWAIAMANDDSHGYSQKRRWGPDYDCSSFVISALAAAGFYVGEAVYTGNMVDELTMYGFRYFTDLSMLRTGDILWVHNSSHQHTEIYLGGGRIVGATSSETGGIDGRAGDQTGREIRVGSYYNMPWAGFLRAA